MLTGLQQIWTAAGLGSSGDGGGGVDHLAFAGGGVEPPRVWMTASNWDPDRLNGGRQGLWSGSPGVSPSGLDSSVEVNRGYVSRDFTGVRRKGFVMSVESRVVFLGEPWNTGAQVMFALGYERF